MMVIGNINNSAEMNIINIILFYILLKSHRE